MRKYNFKNIEVKGIDWKAIELWEVKLIEQIGNALYSYSVDVNVAEIGKRIYLGGQGGLQPEDISKIKEIINDDQKFPFIPLVKRTIIEFLK